jgi:hypothetical protein
LGEALSGFFLRPDHGHWRKGKQVRRPCETALEMSRTGQSSRNHHTDELTHENVDRLEVAVLITAPRPFLAGASDRMAAQDTDDPASSACLERAQRARQA